MKYIAGGESPMAYGSLVIPLDLRIEKPAPKGSAGGPQPNSGSAPPSKRELRKLKRKEKENLWRRSNRRNAKADPVVVYLPKEPLARSALQTLHKESGKASQHHYFQGGLNHDWVDYYAKGVTSDQSCVNEWNAMDNLESKRPPSPDSLTNQEETQLLIRSKLKEVMMTVDIDEVTSKYIRQRLEADLCMDLFKYKSFLDEEMLTILGQMDSATEIFPHVFLGSEWNASNLEELRRNGVGFILNVTKEIDNFFPGMFDYLNIRVYDDEKTELLQHWDKTYKYITQAKEKKSKVLVHCKMGISRSASVVIAYAMKAYNLSLDEARKLVSSKRSCIKPNQAFTQQLKIYQGILDASRQRHNALWRSKSETNLKSPSNSSSRNKQQLRTSRHIQPPLGYKNGLSGAIVIPPFKGERSAPPAEDELDAIAHQDSDPEEVFGPPSCVDRSLLSVPHALHNKRPKSWSPDDDTVNLLFSEPLSESIDFGDSVQKSQSLNDQTWQAHVTVEQQDLRDPGGGISEMDGVDRPVLIEAYNPIYIPHSTPSSPSSQHLDDLQLSSSVKERISEFESVQNSSAKLSCNSSNNSKFSELKSPALIAKSSSPTVIVLENATTDSSSDFETGEGNTDYLDNIIESLLVPLSDPESSSSGEKPSGDQPDASPSEMETDTASHPPSGPKSVELTDPSVVVVPNESITWAAGMVKKQKEDFEEKVKILDSISKSCEKLRDAADPNCNASRLTRSASSVTASEASKSSAGETARKDDPFSSCLDKVFDREEKKQQRHSMVPDLRESPSRNSSWGSFDSAVVLVDRELPSRQSSWGSCDTRFSVGSIPSRNSSFGAFDIKQAGGKGSGCESTSSLSHPQSSISFTCFDKESGIFSPSTIRRNKINKDHAALPLDAESSDMSSCLIEKTSRRKEEGAAKLNANADTSRIDNLSEVLGLTPGKENPTNLNSTSVKPDPDNSMVPESKESQSPYRERVVLKHSPQSPEHEIPLPGTVRQQREKLENCGKASVNDKSLNEMPDVNIPSFVRSLSSGSVEVRVTQASQKGHISRSLSEKRRKGDPNPSGGKVKKITRALENQNVILRSYSSQLGNKNPLKTIKDRLARQKDPMKRSLSLERLCVPQDAESCTSHDKRSDIRSSQNLLGQLVDEVQAQVKELESGTPEEKCVRDIVDMFEETHDRGVSAPSPGIKKVQSAPGSFRISRHKARPRSESVGERVLPPTVPRRKSSLDHNLSLACKSCPPSMAPLRQSLSWSPPTKSKESGGTSFYHCLPHHRSLSSPARPPAACGATSPTSRNHTCGLEVRQTKQQGKSHPLSKLTPPRENTL